MSEQKTPSLMAAIENALHLYIDPEWPMRRAVSEFVAKLGAAGYVIVPKEPTFDMMEAALRAGVGRIYMPGGFERDADKYRAMLAASQQKAGQ
jgi:hypothetical protein